MNESPVVGIIQARMGSTRLPGKSLEFILGQPLLAVLLERVRPAKRLDRLVVATSTKAQDDRIAQLAESVGVPCFRGSEDDVLDRYYHAAAESGARTVVRLTGDNPLVDAGFVDFMLERYSSRASGVRLMCSNHESFPLGMSMEVFPFELLEKFWKEDEDPASREHVTTMAYGDPQRYGLTMIDSPEDCHGMRWTVDEPDDLRFVRTIFEGMGRTLFPWREAVALVRAHPEWAAINRHVRQKSV